MSEVLGAPAEDAVRLRPPRRHEDDDLSVRIQIGVTAESVGGERVEPVVEQLPNAVQLRFAEGGHRTLVDVDEDVVTDVPQARPGRRELRRLALVTEIGDHAE